MQFDLILKLESNSIQSVLLWVLNKIYWIVANNWRSEIWIGKDKSFPIEKLLGWFDELKMKGIYLN